MIDTVQTRLGPFEVYHDLVGTTLASGAFWDEQIRAFLDTADPNGMAIDLGAHIGWFSVYLAQRHAKVLAVEAHPGTFQMLRRNCWRNTRPGQIRCVERAAYDRGTFLHLAPDAWLGWPVPLEENLSTCPSPASIAFVPESPRLAVWAMPIDDVLDPGQPVTLIKVDVQGCDLRALVGLSRTIDRWRPRIAFEFEGPASSWHGDTWEDYLRFFAEREYVVQRVREDLWDYTATPQEETL